MNGEVKEGPSVKEIQIISEIFRNKVIPSMKEQREYLITNSPEEVVRRFCKFSEVDYKVRGEELKNLVPLLESFAEDPSKFNMVDFFLQIDFPPLRKDKWGLRKRIYVVRRPEDPEPLNDINEPQTEIGFMILEDRVSEEEKEEFVRGFEYKNLTPEKIMELKEERFPGEKIIVFAAGIARPKNEVKVNYYAGVQFSCSSIIPHCFKPDGIVLVGSTPFQTPNPITERRMTQNEVGSLKKFLNSLPQEK